MSPTRTLNVVTLSIILLLAGCFGLGDSAEASDDHEHEPNAAPVLHGELMLDDLDGELEFNLADCTGTECTLTAYHASVDPDGDLMELGYDFDLDGTIDYQLTNYRGITDLQIPRTEFVEEVILVDEIIEESNCVNGQQLVVTETSTVSRMITSIALIAVDENDASAAVLLTTSEMYDISTIVSDETEACSFDPASYSFNSRDAADTMSDAAGEKLVHIKMVQGDDLDWSALKVSIVVDGGNSLTCADAAMDDGTADCTYTTDEDSSWSVAEEITIMEGDVDLCDGADGGCDVDVTLTKIGVGNEEDKVIREVTAYADANN
ncbi:MAG: hypothetical protein ACPHUO_02925 [Candidatus Poseidoniaceae archaeon]